MSERLNSHLKKAEINKVKQKLEEESQRIKENFSAKKSEMEDSLVQSKDSIDSANDNILVSTSLRFSNREAFYLKKIEKALAKAETEEFGMCEDCGAPISFTRLLARPTSTMCIDCKEESEKSEMHNIFHQKSQSLGEALNVSGT